MKKPEAVKINLPDGLHRAWEGIILKFLVFDHKERPYFQDIRNDKEVITLFE